MSLNINAIRLVPRPAAVVAATPPLPVAGGGVLSTFLCRVAALPLGSLERLRAPDTVGLATQLLDLQRQHQRERDALSAQLHDVVGRVDASAVRASLIRVRRALYNGRAPTTADVTRCEATLDDALLHSVHDHYDRIHRMRTLHAQLTAAYRRELGEARIALAALARREPVLRGLLLSTPVLYHELVKLQSDPPERAERRLLRIERGVLRYVTRAATKTSPFSAFCEVTSGTFVNEARAPHLAGPRTTSSRMTLNKGLYPPIRDALILRPAIRRAMVVDVNTTLRRDDDVYTFLHGRERKEAVQRLRANPALDHVLALAAASPAPSLGALCDRIATDPALEASPEAAREYVEQLVTAGLLTLHFGFSEQAPDWDARLHMVLSHIDDDDARTAAALLDDLRVLCDRAATTDSTERESLFATMRSRIDNTFLALGAAGRVPHGLPCYEDVSADASGVLPRTEALLTALETLTHLCRATLAFAWPLDEQARMRVFFDRHYGPAAVDVALLTFYEDYHREVVIPDERRRHATRAADGRDGAPVDPRSVPAGSGTTDANPAGSDAPSTRARRAAAARLAAEVGKRMAHAPQAEVLALSKDDLARALVGLDVATTVTTSISLFCHVLPPDHQHSWRIVTNNGQLATGFGKYFSRFLHVLPPAVTTQLRETYAEDDDQIVAEILDDGNFNANLHPRFLAHTIEYPTRPSGAGRGALRCADLRITRAAGETLALVHAPTKRVVVPVDLGFMNPRMRPALFRLLSHFQPVSGAQLPLHHVGVPLEGATFHAVVALLASQTTDAERLRSTATRVAVYRPRIVFAEHVVVARRRWLLSAALVPAPGPSESPEGYFLRCQAWRTLLGLPTQVFVKRAEHPGGAPAAAETEAPLAGHGPREEEPSSHEAVGLGISGTPAPTLTHGRSGAPSRRGQDDYKPQFIDFEAPLLIDLLGRLVLSWADAVVSFEESLPGGVHGWSRDAEQAAVECVLQIEPDRRPGVLPSGVPGSLHSHASEPAHA